jgi:hypothetical protein
VTISLGEIKGKMSKLLINLLSVNQSEHFSNTLPNLDDIILGSLCVYSHVITSTEVVKYLGVHIDKYLNFENIVSNIVSKVKVRLNLAKV